MTDQPTRRGILQAGGATAAAALFGIHHRGHAAPPSAELGEVRTISHQADLYHGWPTVGRRTNGELLVTCSGGRESHICPFGRVELIRSRDDGETWTWPRVLIDSAIDDRDSGVIETARGSLLVTTFSSLAYWDYEMKDAEAAAKKGESDWPKAKLRRWRAAHNRISADRRKGQLGCWMIRSTDGGVSWSDRYRVPVNSPHGPIQLSDGRLLYAGKELWTSPNRIGVAESTDDGQSWRWLGRIHAREGDDHNDYHELHAVETADGRLIAQIRNHNKKSSRWTLQSESTDGGETWSTPRPITWGLPSHLLRLNDDRLLMTYGHRRDPLGNQARVSEDGGRSWSEPIVLYGDGASGDLGYPSTVQLGDGSLLTVWYEKLSGSPKAQLRQMRWSLTG